MVFADSALPEDPLVQPTEDDGIRDSSVVFTDWVSWPESPPLSPMDESTISEDLIMVENPPTTSADNTLTEGPFGLLGIRHEIMRGDRAFREWCKDNDNALYHAVRCAIWEIAGDRQRNVLLLEVKRNDKTSSTDKQFPLTKAHFLTLDKMKANPTLPRFGQHNYNYNEKKWPHRGYPKDETIHVIVIQIEDGSNEANEFGRLRVAISDKAYRHSAAQAPKDWPLWMKDLQHWTGGSTFREQHDQDKVESVFNRLIAPYVEKEGKIKVSGTPQWYNTIIKKKVEYTILYISSVNLHNGSMIPFF